MWVAALGIMLALPIAAAASPAAAQDRPAQDRPAQDRPAQTWSEEKCVRYKKAWADLLARGGRRGLGQDFLDAHDAFLASGCTAKGEVCPRSTEELQAANILTIRAMNAGTASTFLPFACRK